MDGSALRRKFTIAILLAMLFGLCHHVDHLIRNVAGWPFTPIVTTFSISLLVYPLIGLGLYMEAKDNIPRLYWIFVLVPVTLIVIHTHFIPGALDTPQGIIDYYDNTLASTLSLTAFGLLATSLVVSLILSVIIAIRRPRFSSS